MAGLSAAASWTVPLILHEAVIEASVTSQATASSGIIWYKPNPNVTITTTLQDDVTLAVELLDNVTLTVGV